MSNDSKAFTCKEEIVFDRYKRKEKGEEKKKEK